MNMRLFITLSTTVWFILKVSVVVEGHYLVQVRLNGYSNPTGKCGQGRCQTNISGEFYCCDSFDTTCSGWKRCDSYFVYCLRPLGDDNRFECHDNETRDVSSTNSDDNEPINFSLSKVLDLDNPQNFPGLGDAYKGVQLYIEIKDDDVYRPDELVDIISLNINSSVTQSLQQDYTGMYNIVTMNLTVTVFCEENFGGSDCTQCVPGLTGPNCDMIDHCFAVKCSGNGECSMDGMDTVHSTCDPGFTGDCCQTNIDDCVGVDCSGNGQCVDGVNSFTYQCTAGFSGQHCSESDSVTTSASRIIPSVAVLGGGIGGALLLLAIISLLTTCSVIACYCCWTRKFKMENHSDQKLQRKLSDKEDKKLKSDHEFKLKSNEAYSSIIHYIPTEDNVAYGQTALQIEDNNSVCHGLLTIPKPNY